MDKNANVEIVVGSIDIDDKTKDTDEAVIEMSDNEEEEEQLDVVLLHPPAPAARSTSFVEEISPDDITFEEIVGRGAYGVVKKGVWRGKAVAVKEIQSEAEKKAFVIEVRQLSRVDHNNIVKLYGACTAHTICYLVMEYAEGGSLYNVLHSTRQAVYTSAHAMSWALQCARGVEYLHDMKPRALIHRDLKPPNLLLIKHGTHLKICDFGTACDIQTHMTNNKGSAAWMAPEVFEGSRYSEKCDVFSWGIILWEVITRRKPFNEVGGGAFRIMWAVHQGSRPPLVRGCPRPIEILMQRCWHKDAIQRPSMCEVVRAMDSLARFFKGADEPIRYPSPTLVPGDDDNDDDDTGDEPVEVWSDEEGSSSSNITTTAAPAGGDDYDARTRANTYDTILRRDDAGEKVPLEPPGPSIPPPHVMEEHPTQRQTSAPSSLYSSRERLQLPSSTSPKPSGGRGGAVGDLYKRHSTDLARLEQMGFTSHQNQPLDLSTPPSSRFVKGHRRPGSYGGSTKESEPHPAPHQPPLTSAHPEVHHSISAPHGFVMPDDVNVPIESRRPPTRSEIIERLKQQQMREFEMGHGLNQSESVNYEGLPLAYLVLPQEYHPIQPYEGSRESVELYKEHCELAESYLRLITQIQMLSNRKKEVEVRLRHGATYTSDVNPREEYYKLMEEKESLQSYYTELEAELRLVRAKRKESQVTYIPQL